ncbi:MAG TPA: Fe-S cluster assembly protein SufD [Gemmatimonadaceae bacterium]|nr:Fe-S cluster assembly protein SufD [Gemmatimonadaceae bacterium]
MIHSYVDDFANFARNGGAEGPRWLLPVRRLAIERFAQLGFPTPRNEDWHFTSVAPIAEAQFQALRSPSGEVHPTQVQRFTFGTEWPLAVFVNGRFNAQLSSLSRLPQGVRVMELARALTEMPQLLEKHLGKVAPFQEQAFTALNTAFMNDGGVVHVSREAKADEPVHLLFITDANAAKGVAHPRNLIVAERHSTATVIESYVSLGDATYFTNAVTEIVVEDSATLSHFKVQRESPRAFHVHSVETAQRRDSHLVSFSFATGAALSRTNIYTTLGGEGSGATLNGLYMVDGEQHVDHQTRIEHAEPNCYSREIYKGILDGSSHGVFNGKVYVRPVAQKTDGKQTNNNLLLSERARVDTKPQLEIFADDVKCTHGATVGRLDEQALFYMKSRGIDDVQARHLLTYAFAADVLETIPLEPMVRDLERMTLERFAGTEVAAGNEHGDVAPRDPALAATR